MFFLPQNASAQTKMAKKYQQQVKDLTGQYEDEQRQREEQHALAAKAEKRVNDMTLELEELRTANEQVYTVCQHLESLFGTFDPPCLLENPILILHHT